MRIVETDMYCGDYLNEKDVAVGITNRQWAETMCTALQEKHASHSYPRGSWFKVVEDNYVLQPGFES